MAMAMATMLSHADIAAAMQRLEVAMMATTDVVVQQSPPVQETHHSY